MPKSQPKVTVLLPAYNSEHYIKEAIDSILAQTFQDFELLVIDDGSTDNTLKLIQSCNDNRINVISNPVNRGLIASLNIGLKEAKGELIARMDADDISLPERIEKQVKFMDENLNIGASGTWLQFFGKQTDVVKFPTNPKEVNLRFLLGVQIGHACSIIRKELITKFNLSYDPVYKYSEDTDFWVRVLKHCDISNIPEVLYLYRKTDTQISAVNYAEMMQSFCKAVNRHFQSIMEELGLGERFKEFDLYPKIYSKEYFRELETVFILAINRNEERQIYKPQLLEEVLFQFWKNSLAEFEKINNKLLFSELLADRFIKSLKIIKKRKLKFLIRRLIGK